MFFLFLIHTSSVLLTLQLKELRGHRESGIHLSNDNSIRGHKEIRRVTGHIMVTTRRATHTKDPNRDKILARSNHPTTRIIIGIKTMSLGTNYSFYCHSLQCCQYFFGYELQATSKTSDVLPIHQT